MGIRERPFRVAIVGGGPAGAALATLLVSAGAEVVLFADDRRKDPVVGESLIPAIVPLLRRLGVEDAVAEISQHKPGVAFVWSDIHVAFRFARYADRMTPYAYNVPRPGFDEVLQARAVAAGARLIPARAHLARGPIDGPEVVLDGVARSATGWADDPDLLVDASGRGRAATRLLGVPARVGPRDDVAHFAHFVGHAWDEAPGQVLIGRVHGGWSWRIPLRDKLSVGVVLDRRVATGLGDTPAVRLDAAIAATADLSATLREARRVSEVGTHANYQLVTTRGFGRGWVAVGDAFGFVDPMLSPGVSVALHSAEFLADALAPILATGRPNRDDPAMEAAFRQYARKMNRLLAAWMELVEYLYNGRMMALVQAGLEMVAARGDRLALRIQDAVEMNVALLASGTAITSRSRLGLLRVLGRYGLRGVEPGELAIG